VESNPRQATPTTPQAKPSEKRQPTSPLTILLSLCDKSIIEQPKSKKQATTNLSTQHLVIVNKKKAAMILSCVFAEYILGFFFFLIPFPPRECVKGKEAHGTALSCAFLLGAAPAPNDHRRRRRSGDGDRPARGLVKPCSDGHQEIRVLDDSRCTCRATPKKRRGGLRTARRTVQSVSC